MNLPGGPGLPSLPSRPENLSETKYCNICLPRRDILKVSSRVLCGTSTSEAKSCTVMDLQ